MISETTLDRFKCDQLPVTPWKNGGGSTREIACWPPGAGLNDFGWRVSIASIAAPGPFSVFPGVDRHIMLLDGDGVRLRSPDGAIDQRLDQPCQPFAFSGDAAIECSLLGGESSDFNVMTRRGQWQAQLQVRDEATDIEAAPHGVLLALRGNWRVHGQARPVHEGEGCCWNEALAAWRAEPQTPGARLALVRFI